MNEHCADSRRKITFLFLINFHVLIVTAAILASKSASKTSSMISSTSLYLYGLLAVFVLCSVTLTWDTPLFHQYHEHYMSHSTYRGVDVFTESLNSPTGPEHFMENFYICYGRDGRKTYYKKLDKTYFSNKRYWIITSSGKFVASMKTC